MYIKKISVKIKNEINTFKIISIILIKENFIIII